MKKQFLLFVVTSVLLFTTACGGVTSSTATALDKSATNGNGYTNQELYLTAPAQNLESTNTQSSEATTANGSSTQFPKKIVRDGTLNLESKDVEKTYNDVLNFAKSHSGYLSNEKKSLSNGFLSITMQIKIDPNSLEALMNYAGTQATVIDSQISSDDVTATYYDTTVRLQTLKSTLTQYYTLLSQAKTTADIMTVQAKIDELTTNIESMEGQIKLWDSQVSESMVNITINQTNDPLKPKQQIHWGAMTGADMGLLLHNGFIGTFNFICGTLQWITIVLITLLPLIILAGVVFIVVWLLIKRRRKHKAKKDGGK